MISLWALPARGQLSTYVDNQGKLVYTNENSTVPKQAAPKPAAPPSEHAPAPGAASPTTGTATPTVAAAPAAVQTIALVPSKKTPVLAPPPAALDRLVQESADKHHVDPALVRAVITTESNWNSRAVSSKGALGLMQLVPGTAQRLGVRNAFDPAQNVDAGTQYLSTLLERYNGDLNKALAAYNAGPGAVDRFGGVPNYRETREYVQRVTSTYFRPGSERQPNAFSESVRIYRTLEADGRVVFTNE